MPFYRPRQRHCTAVAWSGNAIQVICELSRSGCAGQPTVRLRQTRFRSLVIQAQALHATIARLDAEMLDQAAIAFPRGIASNSPRARAANELLHLRRTKLVDSAG